MNILRSIVEAITSVFVRERKNPRKVRQLGGSEELQADVEKSIVEVKPAYRSCKNCERHIARWHLSCPFCGMGQDAGGSDKTS